MLQKSLLQKYFFFSLQSESLGRPTHACGKPTGWLSTLVVWSSLGWSAGPHLVAAPLWCPQAGVTGAGRWEHWAPWGLPGPRPPSLSWYQHYLLSRQLSWCYFLHRYCRDVIKLGWSVSSCNQESSMSCQSHTSFHLHPHGHLLKWSSWAFWLCRVASQLLESDCLLYTVILQKLEASALCWLLTLAPSAAPQLPISLFKPRPQKTHLEMQCLHLLSLKESL